VPLCNACGGSPTPTLEEIWAKTAKTMGPNDYRCAVCEDIFEKGRPDEIAHAEAKARAPNVPIEECSVVCDDCFKEMAHAGVFPS
jgi:ribosomal protein L34E